MEVCRNLLGMGFLRSNIRNSMIKLRKKDCNSLFSKELKKIDILNPVFFTFEVKNEYNEFTGICDMNGVEIYENDKIVIDRIMTADDSFGLEPNGFFFDNEVFEVVWNSKLAGWDLNWDKVDLEDVECKWKYKRDARGLFITGQCKVFENLK